MDWEEIIAERQAQKIYSTQVYACDCKELTKKGTGRMYPAETKDGVCISCGHYCVKLEQRLLDGMSRMVASR